LVNLLAVLDDKIRIGRMYLEQLPAGAKWCWFLQVMGAPLPNSGIADTLDEAKATIAAHYEAVRRPRCLPDHRLRKSIVDTHPFSKQV
jgi:hypothetical protein